MNLILNYILQNIGDLYCTTSKMVNKQVRSDRYIRCLTAVTVSYILSVGILLKVHDDEIKKMKHEIRKIKQMKGA